MTVESNQEWFHVVRQFVDERLDDVGVSMPGNVMAYDRASQTARVRPAITKRLQSYSLDGEVTYEDRPDLFNVPVIWPGGSGTGTGSSYFHPGLEVGEGVLIVCSDADFAQWRRSGKKSNQRNEDAHVYRHSVCIPGLNPRAAALPDSDVILAAGGVTRSVAVADQLTQIFNAFSVQLGLAIAANPGPIAAALTPVQAAWDAAKLGVNFNSPYIKTGGL